MKRLASLRVMGTICNIPEVSLNPARLSSRSPRLLVAGLVDGGCCVVGPVRTVWAIRRKSQVFFGKIPRALFKATKSSIRRETIGMITAESTE